MTAGSRIHLSAALLPLLLGAGCHSDQASDTAIIVEVSSDLAVPTEINQVYLLATDPQGTPVFEHTFDLGVGQNRVALPFRTGLYPLHSSSTPIRIAAAGQLDGQSVVTRSATLSFVGGKKVVLQLPLLAVCKPVKCAVATTTCKANGKCEPNSVAPSDLPNYVPNQPISGTDAASAIPDAATADVALDAAVDGTADRQADRAPDTTGGRDAFSAAGGAGGTDAFFGTGGAIGTDGAAVDVGIAPVDAPAADVLPDVPVGGSGGTGGKTVTGGVTASGGKTSTGGVTTSGGTTASGGSTGGVLTSGGTTTTGGTTATGGTTGPALKAPGALCAGTGECQAGLTCLDGVCCTQASCPQCQNCGAAGTCSITVSSAEDTTGATCAGTSACNVAGACKKKSGETCATTADCAAGTCTDNRCCSQTCGICQACTGAGGTCVAVTSADDADTCTGATTCNAAGVCKKKSGENCTATGDCATGTCTDNRCCSQTCGVCQACTGAGGTCVAVTSADDADTCTGANTCSASGSCGLKSGQACTPPGNCAAGTCTDNRCCSQTCGVCQACTGAGGTCVAVISADDPDSCTGANSCDGTGACKRKNGQACTTGTDCVSGTCNANVCGPAVATRCAGLAPTCGPLGTGDCCASLPVTGGTFYRSYDGVDYTDKSYPATVADFYLDKYEITVGRFRQFVNAGMGTQLSPPADGAGLHPLIPGSGWNSTWKTNLTANTAALTTALKCSSGYQTWTDAPGANESKPQNCIDWYEAFAFCAWDGGRLATEAEWNYAAAGGSEQRAYPWSNPPTSTTIDDSYAVYCGGSCSSTQNAGSKSPKGDGKWGHSDLAGNVWEWTLDWYTSPYQAPCNNCADLTAASTRVIRGGSFYSDASDLRSAYRHYGGNPDYHDDGIGARCARTSL